MTLTLSRTLILVFQSSLLTARLWLRRQASTSIARSSWRPSFTPVSVYFASDDSLTLGRQILRSAIHHWLQVCDCLAG